MNKLILVAEDSKTQADMLCHILHDAGYATMVAGNGREALSRIREQMPDLVLTDIVMPEMNGYELCSAIKSDPELANLPVILVTQLYDPEDVIHGLSCGANNFIIKPYTRATLISRISAVSNPDGAICGEDETGVEYDGTFYQIQSKKKDILQILLSIYDTAVSRNMELEQATERLNVLTGSLEHLVEERTLALQRTAGTVEQLLMQKNELITKIGHDLKTPLTLLPGSISRHQTHP